MTEAVLVRSARRDDLPHLVDIYNYYVLHSSATFDTTPVTVESRTAWFSTFRGAGPYHLLVACAEGRVVGCASSTPYRSHPAFAETVELSVYLEPEAHGRGVGSALYDALLELLRAESVHVAVAAIALPNEASVALHRKFGFTKVGVFREYAVKNGAYVSSVWMQLDLRSAATSDTPGRR